MNDITDIMFTLVFEPEKFLRGPRVELYYNVQALPSEFSWIFVTNVAI